MASRLIAIKNTHRHTHSFSLLAYCLPLKLQDFIPFSLNFLIPTLHLLHIDSPHRLPTAMLLSLLPTVQLWKAVRLVNIPAFSRCSPVQAHSANVLPLTQQSQKTAQSIPSTTCIYTALRDAVLLNEDFCFTWSPFRKQLSELAKSSFSHILISLTTT